MNLSHHAYYLEGPTDLLAEVVEEAKKALGFPKGSPDIHAAAYEKFGIEEARALIGEVSLKATAGKALFVIAAASMHSEAQQALLKLLEEPPLGTTLILIVPFGALLPTVRSRCLALPYEVEAGGSKEAKAFLKAAGKERSALIAELLEEEEGTRERAREFLSGLEREVHAAFAKKSASAEERRALGRGLEDIARFRMYLGDRAPSLKMLLEHLAASLPKL